TDEAVHELWRQVRAETGPTEFLGYGGTTGEGTVLRVVAEGKDVPKAGPGGVKFVTDRTPFYGEQGGQIGDTGEAVGDGVRIRVTDATRPGGGLVVPHGNILEGTPARGARLQLSGDALRRGGVRQDH